MTAVAEVTVATTTTPTTDKRGTTHARDDCFTPPPSNPVKEECGAGIHVSNKHAPPSHERGTHIEPTSIAALARPHPCLPFVLLIRDQPSKDAVLCGVVAHETALAGGELKARSPPHDAHAGGITVDGANKTAESWQGRAGTGVT